MKHCLKVIGRRGGGKGWKPQLSVESARKGRWCRPPENL